MKYKDISADWPKYNHRAGYPKTRREVEIDMLVIHCTADDDMVGEDVYRIINYATHPNHVCSTGCWTIFYHYYIESVRGETTIWKTAPHDIQTFHAGLWNKRSLGIVVDKKEQTVVTEDKYKALVELLVDLCITYKLNPYVAIVGHRNLYWTGWEIVNGIFKQKKTCPGVLPIITLQDDVVKGLEDEGYICPTLVVTPYMKNLEPYVTLEYYDHVNSANFLVEKVNANNLRKGICLWKT